MLECQKEGAHIKKSTLKQVLGKKLFFVFFKLHFSLITDICVMLFDFLPLIKQVPQFLIKGKPSLELHISLSLCLSLSHTHFQHKCLQWSSFVSLLTMVVAFSTQQNYSKNNFQKINYSNGVLRSR